MIYFLRDRHNRTLIEVEFYTTIRDDGSKYHEMGASINIIPYTDFIMRFPDKATEIAIIFDAISESRGWLWETYYMVGSNDGLDEDYDKIYKRMDNLFSTVAEKYYLIYVTD